MKNISKTAQAQILGTKAFLKGKKRIPAHDKNLDALLEGLQVGQSGKIINGWLLSWDLANLNYLKKTHAEAKKRIE